MINTLLALAWFPVNVVKALFYVVYWIGAAIVKGETE